MKRLLITLATFTLIIFGLFTIKLKPKRVIIGDYAGECYGNCGTMYEVTNKMIRIDTTSFWLSHYNLENLQIKGQRCLEHDDERDFNAFKLKVPIIMLIDTQTRFGCPDCLDQGGYYLEFILFGIKRQFQIEKGEESFYFPNLTNDIDTLTNKIENELQKYGK